MGLLKALGMPFQISSLLFVGMTSMMLGVVLSIGDIAVMLALPLMCLLLIWFTRFTFTLIDDATNGAEETATASVEMANPWGDPRCWVHPVLTLLVAIALLVKPEIPRLPVLVCCALLLPASIGAIALTGHSLDALNPFAMVRVVRGLAHYYLMAVVWLVLCVGAAVLLMQSGMWLALKIAALQLLLLLAFAFIGGALHARRVELGFVPLVSPERIDERKEDQRIAERQRVIDGLYVELRGNEPARALASARQWIETLPSQHVTSDVRALIDAGSRWSEPRRYSALLRGLLPQLLSRRQQGMAFAAAEAGLAAMPTFAPEQEADTIALVRYALQTGRKRLAATLLENFMATARSPSPPGAELLELRARLRNEPAATQSLS